MPGRISAGSERSSEIRARNPPFVLYPGTSATAATSSTFPENSLSG